MAAPFNIHLVNGRYLIFDPDVLRLLREVHHICGVLLGTLPQISQQNVFLGLPLQLMVEEAYFLVKQGFARIIDDLKVHRQTVEALTPTQVEDFRASKLRDQARLDLATRQVQLQKRREALEKRGLTHLIQQLEVDDTQSADGVSTSTPQRGSVHVSTASSSTTLDTTLQSQHLDALLVPKVDMARYNIFKHLHDRGYFMTPGLRFGAQFVAYPGDPLRFHSHYIVTGRDWDEPVPVMDIVGGGRLGTGVKKAWLVGAKRPAEVQTTTSRSRVENGNDGGTQDDNEHDGDDMKCFTVEWAGI